MLVKLHITLHTYIETFLRVKWLINHQMAHHPVFFYEKSMLESIHYPLLPHLTQILNIHSDEDHNCQFRSLSLNSKEGELVEHFIRQELHNSAIN